MNSRIRELWPVPHGDVDAVHGKSKSRFGPLIGYPDHIQRSLVFVDTSYTVIRIDTVVYSKLPSGESTDGGKVLNE